MLIILSAVIFIPVLVKRTNSASIANIVGFLIAISLLSFKIGEPIFRLFRGQDWLTLLPLQLCDVGAIAISLFLFHKKMLLFEVGYFWGLGGGIQAVVTPDLQLGFPNIDYFFYFATHGLCFVGVIYAIVVFKYRPLLKSVWRIFFITFLYAVFIFPFNLIFNTNYLFLSQKPEGTSLMDFLGPWPWYIISLIGVGFVFFLLYYSPFYVADVLKRLKNQN